MKTVKLFAALLAGASTLPLALPGAQASTWPEQPVRVVVNYPPGGSSDTLTRVALSAIGDSLGKPIVVENKPGANGNIGTSYVAKSRPDGYTLVASGLSGVSNSFLYKKLNYRFADDLVPVALIARNPGVLIVNKSLPVKNVQELIAYGRAQPHGLHFASGGQGSSLHVNGEIFKQSTGLNMTHVAYRGEAPATNDLIGGQVQMMFAVLATAKPLIEQGQVRPLAVTSPRRAEALPELPTLMEQGIGFGVYSWLALFAPAGTPPDVVEKLNAAIRHSLRQPNVQARLKELGAETADMSVAEIKAYTQSELRYWGDALGKLNIQLD